MYGEDVDRTDQLLASCFHRWQLTLLVQRHAALPTRFRIELDRLVALLSRFARRSSPKHSQTLSPHERMRKVLGLKTFRDTA